MCFSFSFIFDIILIDLATLKEPKDFSLLSHGSDGLLLFCRFEKILLISENPFAS